MQEVLGFSSLLVLLALAASTTVPGCFLPCLFPGLLPKVCLAPGIALSGMDASGAALGGGGGCQRRGLRCSRPLWHSGPSTGAGW